jgi:hypothetical protein
MGVPLMKKPNLSGGGLVKRVLLRKAKALRWKQSKGYLMKKPNLRGKLSKKVILKSQNKGLWGELQYVYMESLT